MTPTLIADPEPALTAPTLIADTLMADTFYNYQVGIHSSTPPCLHRGHIHLRASIPIRLRVRIHAYMPPCLHTSFPLCLHDYNLPTSMSPSLTKYDACLLREVKGFVRL